jgi:hypothetical protein
MESMHNEVHTITKSIFNCKKFTKIDLTSGTFEAEIFPCVVFSAVVRGTIIARSVIDRFTRNMYAMRHPMKHIIPIFTRTGYMVSLI